MTIVSRRKSMLFGACCFLAIGIFFLVIGTPGLVKELKLRSGGAITQANVTAWRVHQGKYGTSYDVQYAFDIPGKSESYTMNDTFPFRRQNLWPSIPLPLWEETKNTGVVDVRYLPAAPEVNRPEASSSLADAATGVLGGIVSCTIGFFWFLALRRR